MTTDQKLRETLDLLEQQRLECVRLTTTLTDMSERLIAKEGELVAVKRELDIAKADLAEQISVDEKIAAFNKELSKVESMKRNYEKTITMLRGRLNDARKRLGEQDNYDLFETIRMDEPAPPRKDRTVNNPAGTTRDPAPHQETKAPEIPEEVEEDVEDEWLDDIPTARDADVGRLDAALRHNPKKKPKLGEIIVEPGKQADDDWLISLPEDL